MQSELPPGWLLLMSAFFSLLFTPPHGASHSSSSGHSISTRISSATSGHEEGTRQCWICFAEEPIDAAPPSSSDTTNNSTIKNNWVRPCKCSGTTAWVHQSCLLDWMDVKMRAGHSLSQPMTCPQCHAQYRIKDSYALPWPVLVAVNACGRAMDRFLMYAALAGLAGCGYGGLFGYGAGVFTASIGPSASLSFFKAHMGIVRAESIVKVFLGMPMIALSVLAAAFPSLSWVFPIIPPILYANDVIEWTVLSPKLLALSLPFALFAYRFGEVYVPKLILNCLGRKADTVDEADAVPIEENVNVNSPHPTEDSQVSSVGLEDERAIRVSVLSTTGVLCLPFLSAGLGAVLFRRMHPFYRMLATGALLVSFRDILRTLSWYQQVLIRPYRRVLPFAE